MYRVVVDRLIRLMTVVLVASGSLQSVVVRFIVGRLSGLLRSHLRQMAGFKDIVVAPIGLLLTEAFPLLYLRAGMHTNSIYYT